jgi:hypothetical protein
MLTFYSRYTELKLKCRVKIKSGIYRNYIYTKRKAGNLNNYDLIIIDKDYKSLKIFIAETIFIISSTILFMVMSRLGSSSFISRLIVWLRIYRTNNSLILSFCRSTSVYRCSPFFKKKINAFFLRRLFFKIELD